VSEKVDTENACRIRVTLNFFDTIGKIF